MTNRELAFIVKDQKPIVLAKDATVRDACRAMAECGAGSVLVTDGQNHLVGIFTGRDAVGFLAKGKDAGATPLSAAMTRNPQSIAPASRAVDALRIMSEGGFRHVPVVEDGKIRGVVSRSDFKGMEFERYARHLTGEATPSGAFRTAAEIVGRKKPLALSAEQTVADACQAMARRKLGSTVVVDGHQHVKGIFTGRDAVRVLASAKDPGATPLAKAMTRNPVSVGRADTVVDALRKMHDGGFRHIPVVEGHTVHGVIARSDVSGVELDRLEEEVHLWESIW